jgi:hypothetical protein
MYCTNCGNIIVGTGLTCTNCGAVLSSSVSIKHKVNTSPFVVTGNSNISSGSYKSDDSEYITIREREKRITEERIKKEIDAARVERERLDSENKNLASEFQTANLKRVIGEKVITGTPEEVKKRYKISSTKKFLITTGTFVTGFVVFILCMGYLFWRFAPPGDNYKHQFAEWMTENANSDVNNFIFKGMKLNQYYVNPKDVNYTGTYLNRLASGPSTIYLEYSKGTLNGRYYKNGFYYRLAGYTGVKGDFLLMETFNGKTTATITGTLFPTGYMTAERNEPGGKKDILSMERQ